jgi:RimJ/RimL family protein N-acetyltransferase
MLIRPYSSADADAVNKTALAAFEQYRGVYSDWDVLERGVGSMACLADTGEILVAEADGTVVGAVAYIGPQQSPRADFFEPEWPIIRMLVVDPAARGQGLGRKLTEACLELARRDGAEVIALHTSPAMEVALALYLKLGFKLLRSAPDRFGVPYAVYVKPLGEPIMTIEARRLDAEHLWLEPLREEHRAEMQSTLASDPGNWLIQSASALGEHFPAYWAAMLNTPRRITLAAFARDSGQMVGTSSMFDIDPQHRTLEIGYTWFRPEYRGTAVNPAAKLLMLGEAFLAGARRVQFSVSAVNERSQAAMLKLGAKQEGTLRNHRITWTGASRDTVLFSITEQEWPVVKQGLIARLAAHR